MTRKTVRTKTNRLKCASLIQEIVTVIETVIIMVEVGATAPDPEKGVEKGPSKTDRERITAINPTATQDTKVEDDVGRIVIIHHRPQFQMVVPPGHGMTITYSQIMTQKMMRRSSVQALASLQPSHPTLSLCLAHTSESVVPLEQSALSRLDQKL